MINQWIDITARMHDSGQIISATGIQFGVSVW